MEKNNAIDINTQLEDIVDLREDPLQYPVQWIHTEERWDKTAGKYVNRPDGGYTQLEDIVDLREDPLQYPVQWIHKEERWDKTAGKYDNRPDGGNTQLEDIVDLREDPLQYPAQCTVHSVLTQKKAKSNLLNSALDGR